VTEHLANSTVNCPVSLQPMDRTSDG